MAWVSEKKFSIINGNKQTSPNSIEKRWKNKSGEESKIKWRRIININEGLKLIKIKKIEIKHW